MIPSFLTKKVKSFSFVFRLPRENGIFHWDVKPSKISGNLFLLILCAGFFVLGFGISKASAATYYMRADGTAANKVAATGPASDPTKCMSATTHNSQTFSADDVILISSQGGNFTSQIAPPSSGTSSGHRIIYRAVNGESPSVQDVTQNRSFYIGAKSYITVDGLTILPGIQQGFYALTGTGIIIQNSTVSGITGIDMNGIEDAQIINCSVHGLASSASYAARIRGAINACTVTDLNVTSGDHYGLYIEGCSNPVLTRVTTTATADAGIYVKAVGNMTLNISGASLTGIGTNASQTSHGCYIDGNSTAGLNASLTNVISNSFNGDGIFVGNGTYSTINITNPSVNHNFGSGLRIDTANGAVINSGQSTYNAFDGVRFNVSNNDSIIGTEVSYNGIDGVSFYLNAANGVVKNCKVHHNGQIDVTGNGDGVTAHAGCTGLSVHHNLVYNNRNSGFAFINGSTGAVYNNSIYSNGDSASSNMGVRGGWYSGVATTGWTIKNNIFQANYPNEIKAYADSIPTLDNNQYYHVGNNVTEANAFSLNGGTTQLNWATYHTTNGNELNSNYGNPLFTSSSDFHLQSTSPAINAGTDVGLTADYDGNPKSGASWDIGAYEFQDSTAPTTTANLNSGTYNTHQSVTLTCDDGAGVGCDKTYYTLTGIDPTTSSTIYSTPISIPDNATTILKFFSTDKNANAETIKSKTYIVDTVAPIISGITNNQTYTTSQTPTFDEGTATLNGNPYTSGTTISTIGTYTLIVTDSATNSTTVNFTIANEPIVTPSEVVTSSHKGDNDNHKHKSHHKAKPKTLKQKVQQNFKSAQKWIKKQTTVFNRNLSLGSKGNDVGLLQQTLQKLGLMKIKDTTYGIYLSTTQKAVEKLQQIKNIFPTGNFGILTRRLFGW